MASGHGMDEADAELPLAGLAVVEFTHMVMGPAIGLILADLGAEVIRIEPIGGDPTRRLLGSGAGYHPMFNRNKRSLCLDLKSADGVALARRLVERADVMIENYRSGTLARLGLGADSFIDSNPGLVACSAKGFLRGPYEDRTALDEVAQMMGGLAYMTGPPGRPLRAGASVIDITGGMFGVIGILAALVRRQRTDRGGEVRCSLFETTAFLVGQHMAQQAVTDQPVEPMPARTSAWAIYDIFATAVPGEDVFVGVVSDGQWATFVRTFDLGPVGSDPAYAANNQRVLARSVILPVVRTVFARHTRSDLVAILEKIGLPFAPVIRPDELAADLQLSNGGLVDVTLADGRTTRLPGLPLEIDGRRAAQRRDLARAGDDTAAILAGLGVNGAEVERLRRAAVVG